MLKKEVAKKKTLSDYLQGDEYYQIEKIYDRNLAGIELLESFILKLNLQEQKPELQFDVRNLKGNQLRYERIRRTTLFSFSSSLIFVMFNLILIILANELVRQLEPFPFYLFYFSMIGILFFQYVRQIKILIT